MGQEATRCVREFRPIESDFTVPDLQCALPRTPTSSVLICDARSLARRELTALLTSGPAPFRVTATLDAAGMIQHFGHTPADVVMIGVHPGSGFGLTMTLLLDPYPAALVIVYGRAHDSVLLTSAVARGAHGVLIWDTGHRNHSVTRFPGGVPGRRKSVRPVTVRELQVLQGMSLGRSNSTIGRELHLSEESVKTHARRLFSKIGAVDRAHAVALGLRTGLL
jgi:DNA-binding NarL/FixJ family response regulator